MLFYPHLIKRYGQPCNKINSKNMTMRNWEKIFFIAEVGTGHVGNIDLAIKMVDACVAHGVSAIKFQHVIADEILHPLSGKVKLASGEINLYYFFKKIEKQTGINFWSQILNYCKKKKILFLCSFFGSKSFSDLKKLGVEAYKIASPEMNYYLLWQHLLTQSEPVFFSSGIAKMKDIKHLINFFKRCSIDFERLVHLHCVTQYPANPENYNLLFTIWFENHYRILTGLSDHSSNPFLLPSIFTALKAWRNSPVVIEKHFSLSTIKNNIDDPVTIDENELSQLMKLLEIIYNYFSHLSDKNFLIKKNYQNVTDLAITIKKGFAQLPSENKLWTKKINNATNMIASLEVDTIKKILGDVDKSLSHSEELDYLTTKRSLLAIRDINAEEIIGRHNSAYLRSEKNIRPGLDYSWEEKVIGLRVKKSIKNGHPITKNNLLIT